MKRSGFKQYGYDETLERLKAKRQGKKPTTRFGLREKPLQRGTKALRAGKKTRAWEADRRVLKIDHERMGIVTCELRGNKEVPHECSYDNFLSFAHDAKRRKLKREDLKRAILICLNAHNVIEFWSAEKMKRIVNQTIERRAA